MKDCRCGEPAFGRCAYCQRPVCLDCADAHLSRIGQLAEGYEWASQALEQWRKARGA